MVETIFLPVFSDSELSFGFTDLCCTALLTTMERLFLAGLCGDEFISPQIDLLPCPHSSVTSLQQYRAHGSVFFGVRFWIFGEFVRSFVF